MDVTILLTSAILAWPSPWRRRIAASLASALALYVLNVVRICSLYFIGLHFPSFFEVAHLDVWPALILVLAVGAFLRITAFDTKAPADEAT
jgi:exosortase/archaeosortase family protein